MRRQMTRFGAAAFLAVAVMVLSTALGFAAETTRSEYKARVEPICKVNTEANEKILAGVRQRVKEGKLKAASRQFAAAAKALKRTWRELGRVEQPSADVAKLTKWLDDVETEFELFEQIATKLAKGQKTAAEKMVVRLISNANRTNNQVLEFEFHYCRFRPSKFI